MFKRGVLIFLLATTAFATVIGQSIEAFSSLVIQNYYNYPDKTVQSDYTSGLGMSVGLGVNDIDLKVTSLRFTVRYLYYTSGFYTLWGARDDSPGGQGSYWVTHQGKIYNQSLSLGIYPVNIKWFKKRFVFSLGTEIELLLATKVDGVRIYEDAFRTKHRFELSKEKINNGAHISAVAQVAYQWKIAEDWEIVPAYCFYLGLTNQFGSAYMGVAPKPIKHLITVAIHKKILPKKEAVLDKNTDNL